MATIYLVGVAVTFVIFFAVCRHVKDGSTIDQDLKVATVSALVWFVSVPLIIKTAIEFGMAKYKDRAKQT